MNNDNQNDELLNAFENPNGQESTSEEVATPVEESEKEEPINQNQPDHLDVEPSVNVEHTLKEEKDIQDDPNFMKKNLKFILIIFAVILLFIIFLPKIMELLGTSY